jgi:hypothetical protein
MWLCCALPRAWIGTRHAFGKMILLQEDKLSSTLHASRTKKLYMSNAWTNVSLDIVLPFLFSSGTDIDIRIDIRRCIHVDNSRYAIQLTQTQVKFCSHTGSVPLSSPRWRGVCCQSSRGFASRTLVYLLHQRSNYMLARLFSFLRFSPRLFLIPHSNVPQQTLTWEKTMRINH